MTLVLDLSDEETQRLRTLAAAQGTDEVTALRGLIAAVTPSREVHFEHQVSSLDDAEIVEENGIHVLTGRNVHVDDWTSLLESERQARIDSLCHG